MSENTTISPGDMKAALPPPTCSACLGGSPVKRLIEWRSRNSSAYAEARNAGQKKSEKVKAQRIKAFESRDKAQAARSRNPKFMKTPLHIRAKIWQLCDDKRRVHKFRNLADWIRKNPGLFSPEDVAWKERPTRCRAYDGLRSLRPDYKRPAGSWKGWTWKEPNAKLRDAAPRSMRPPEPPSDCDLPHAQEAALPPATCSACLGGSEGGAK